MHKNNLGRIVGVLILGIQLLFCLSCGSGGGSTLAGGGIGGTGITVGSVSGFGSVIVIDDKYNTETAEVIVEGEFVGVGDQAVLDNIDIGKVVRVEGSFANDADRAAARIFYNDNVEGPVDQIIPIPLDNSNKILIVMGQPLIVNVNTIYKNTSFDTIAEGNVIEVSGLVFELDIANFANEVRSLRATFVEKKDDALIPPDRVVELQGIVQDLNEGLETFNINLLEINYANISDSLPEGVPANGQLLEVKGTLSGDTLIAEQITLEKELGTSDADFVKIEGFVTVFNSILDFTLGNLLVETDVTTIFEGILPGEIEIGKKLLIEGELLDDVLLADRIQLLP